MEERETIQKYLHLISEYTREETSASEFSRQYLTEFKDEDGGLSDETFEILQHMFGAADAYCADPDLRGGWEIGEEELMETAVETADRLEKRLEELDD